MRKLLVFIQLIVICLFVQAQRTAVELTYPAYKSFNQNYRSNLKSYDLNKGSGQAPYNRTHAGKDIKGVSGDKLYTLAAGVVVNKFVDGAYGGMGNGILIKYPGIGDGGIDLYGLYLHLKEPSQLAGNVKAGQLIGLMGNTGTELVHCHFELRTFPELFHPTIKGGPTCTGDNIYICGKVEDNPSWTSQWFDPATYIPFPYKVELWGPKDSAKNQKIKLPLTWGLLNNVNTSLYRIQVSNSSTFSSLLVDQVVSGNVFEFNGEFNKEYFWRVCHSSKGFNENDEVRVFYTKPQPPTIIFPSAGVSNIDPCDGITLKWEMPAGSVNNELAYRVQISKNSSLAVTQNEIQKDDPILVFDSKNYVDRLYQTEIKVGGKRPANYKANCPNLDPNTIYYMRIRIKNKKGISRWVSRSFKTGLCEITSQATTLHYSINSSPFRQVVSDNEGELQIPVNETQPGVNSLLFYFKDANGKRSAMMSKSFLNTGGRSELVGAPPSEVEYWFNNDFAARKTAPLPGTGEQEIQFDAADLDQGIHTLHWRTRAKGDLWSSVFSSTFTKSARSDGVTQMEYWFNDAFDQRKLMAVSSLDQLEENIDVSALPLGNHKLFYRFQYAGGKWSGIGIKDFSKRTGAPLVPTTYAFQMQYWIDSAAGKPSIHYFDDISNISLPIHLNYLDSGRHTVHVRFRRMGGLWSSITSREFYKADTPLVVCPLVPSSDSEAVRATRLFCETGVLQSTGTDCISLDNGYFKRKDLALLTMRALVNDPANFPQAKVLPSLFGDLQKETAENECYFSAAKMLSYLDYGDGIAPFNASRLNFNPNDTIVRGYALKVLMEAWDIKPDANLPNPYDDLLPGAEVNGYILKAAQIGLIKRPDIHGSNFASFRPFRAITRDEAFIMLYRLMMTAARPEVTTNDLLLPFNRSNMAGNNPGLMEGNFSSYGEAPFNIKGVPGLNFSFNYNSSLVELPESATRGRNWEGKLLYDKEPLGKGWTHNLNAYIVVDPGNDDINAADDRWMMVWPGGDIHMYQPQQARYLTMGVYDKVSYSGGIGAIPTQITITKKNQVKYVFDKLAGSPTGELLHLIRIEDRHGNAITLNYEDGFSENAGLNIKRLKRVSDPQGRYFDFSYVDQTNLISKVDSKAGNISRSISLIYVGGRLTTYTNPKGDLTKYNYGTSPLTANLIFSIELPRGNVITNTYSANRKLQSTAYTGGSKTIVDARPEYTAQGIRTKSETTTVVDGRTIKSSAVLNELGAPVLATGPLKNDSIAYADSRHPQLPTYIEDRIKDVVTRIEYDANGNPTRTRVETGGNTIETSTTYNSMNDVLSQTDAKGHTTTYQYNGLGQLTEMRAPIGITRFTPNTNGTVRDVTNPTGIITRYGYDNFGNPTSVLMPLQIETRQEWDSAGRLMAKWDARGTKAELTYDPHDNLLQETFDPDGLNQITKYRYDKNDNLIEIENAKGGITYLEYNNEDQMVKQQFGEYAKRFEYHADGGIKSLTTPNNARFNYRYNQQGQLASDGYATYGYYPDGALQTISRGGQTLTYRYDAFNRIAQSGYSDFADNNVSYEYDANGNIERIVYPTGFSVLYAYDANNRLTQVKDESGQPWVTYQYMDDGRLSTATNRNGTISKYFYDAAGRMDSLVNVKSNGEVMASYGFELDKAGNHTQERFQQPLMQMLPQFSRTDTFTYNNINRLLTRNEEQFGYDPNGNLTDHTIPGSDGKYYVYDTKDNLVRFEEDGQLITYDYDGLEQRRRRNDVRYVLDNNYNVLMETDLDGNPLYYYVHGLGLVSRIKANTQEAGYYHYDYRGSTVAITNTAQEITHQYNYDAFGVLQQAVEDDFNAYRYVGKYGVAYESKDLMFMRARYYQPSVGRFLSEDPVWAVNLYPYAGNSPLINIDPSGKIFIEAAIIGGIVLTAYLLTRSGQTGVDIVADPNLTKPINPGLDKFDTSNGKGKNVKKVSDLGKLK